MILSENGHFIPRMFTLRLSDISLTKIPMKKKPRLKNSWGGGLSRVNDTYRHRLDSCFDEQQLNDPIAEMAYYALSHAVVEPGTQIYSAFGFMADLRKDGGAVPVRYDCTCPKCHSPVAYGRDTDTGYRFEDGRDGDQYRMRRITAFARWVLIKGIDKFPEPKRKKKASVWGDFIPPGLAEEVNHKLSDCLGVQN